MANSDTDLSWWFIALMVPALPFMVALIPFALAWHGSVALFKGIDLALARRFVEVPERAADSAALLAYEVSVSPGIWHPWRNGSGFHNFDLVTYMRRDLNSYEIETGLVGNTISIRNATGSGPRMARHDVGAVAVPGALERIGDALRPGPRFAVTEYRQRAGLRAEVNAVIAAVDAAILEYESGRAWSSRTRRAYD